MSGIFERFATRKRKAVADAKETYWRLVHSLASDATPTLSDDEVDALLATVGKSIDAMEADVAVRRKRIADHSAMAAGEKASDEIRRIDEQFAKLDAALKVVHEKYDADVAPLRSRRVQLEDLHRKDFQAKARLKDSCQDESLIAKRDELSKSIDRIGAERVAAQDQLSRRQSTLDGEIDRQKCEGRKDSQKIAEYTELVKQSEARLEALTKSLNDFVAESGRIAAAVIES